jgi:hypothetical protein
MQTEITRYVRSSIFADVMLWWQHFCPGIFKFFDMFSFFPQSSQSTQNCEYLFCMYLTIRCQGKYLKCLHRHAVSVCELHSDLHLFSHAFKKGHGPSI